MTDIKKLLADASPRPWTMQVNELSSLVSAHDADGEPLDLLFDERVAALTLYAVNRLERYEALLSLVKVARCPNCEGEGFTIKADITGYSYCGKAQLEGVQVQCQWCHERDEALAALENDE